MVKIEIYFSTSSAPYSLGLVGDGAFIHLVQVVPHAHGQPVADLPTVHCVCDPEHFSSGEAQTDGGVCLVVKVGTDVEVVSQVGLLDLPVN